MPPSLAAGSLLVSRAGLQDPSFAQSVVLLVEAGEDGAWGLILNRPTELALGRAFPDVEAFRGQGGVLHFGGPVDAQARARARAHAGRAG